ncbi:MAG: hypothetical protein WC732_02135 [Candidatus Omnitrophota bacterium]
MLTKALRKLPEPMSNFIRQAGEFADELKMNVYVVGGFVRDLYLDVPNFDVDLVVEGEGIFFAQECARRLSLKAVTHRRFGTATLHGCDGFKADVASARKETYEKPGALPVVSQGQIKDDLSRRDFTINAMAISINRSSYGETFDFYGGLTDLKNGKVRILHSLSFVDDPTRILRAVRFEQRFCFRLEEQTLKSLRRAVRDKMLLCVQKHRLRDELILIFGEERPWKALRRLEALCGFSFIAPSFSCAKGWEAQGQKVRKAAQWFEANCPGHRRLEVYVMFMCLFFSCLPTRRLKDVIFSYAFHKGESLRMLSFKKHGRRVDRLLSAASLRPSRVYRLLAPLSYEVIMLIFALTKSARSRRRIRDFLLFYNGVRLHVRGEDLVQMGAKPGPLFKKVLERLLFAKLDGKVKNKEEELSFAQRRL